MDVQYAMCKSDYIENYYINSHSIYKISDFGGEWTCRVSNSANVALKEQM